MIWGRAIFMKDVASKGQWETHIGEGERVHIFGIWSGGQAGKLGVGGGWEEERDMCILMADSCCCTAETNTIL